MLNEVLGSVAGGIFGGFTGKEAPSITGKPTVTDIAVHRAHSIGDAIRTIYEKIVEDNRAEQTQPTAKQTEEIIANALDKANVNQEKRNESVDAAKHSHEEALLKEIADNTKALLDKPAAVLSTPGTKVEPNKQKLNDIPHVTQKPANEPTTPKEQPKQEKPVEKPVPKAEPQKTTKEQIRELIKETVVGKSTGVLESKGGMLGKFAADVIGAVVKEKSSIGSALGSTIRGRAEAMGPIGKIATLLHDAYKEKAARTDAKDVVKPEPVKTSVSDFPEQPRPEPVKPRTPTSVKTSSGLSIPPQKKTKLALEMLSAFGGHHIGGPKLTTIPRANINSSVMGAARNVGGGMSPAQSPMQEPATQEPAAKESGDSMLTTIANIASIAAIAPKAAAMLPGLAAAGTTALAAGGVAAAGAAGYGIGTLIQPSVDKFFGGESGSIGSRIYDWLNPGVDSAITAPVPAKSVPPSIPQEYVPPIASNPSNIQSEINTAIDVVEKMTAEKESTQQPIIIQQPANQNNQQESSMAKTVFIRNIESSFERVQMNDYWPARVK